MRPLRKRKGKCYHKDFTEAQGVFLLEVRHQTLEEVDTNAVASFTSGHSHLFTYLLK